MAGPGFKIADGYVEVHADYDKSELRRAAQRAADDFGDDFGRESAHETTKSFNREFAKNFADNFDKEGRIKSVVAQRMVHALIDGMRDQVHKQGSEIDRTGRTFAERLSDGIKRHLHNAMYIDTRLKRRLERQFARGGDGAASSFVKRFVEAVTLGMADLPGANPRSAFAGKMAKFGTALGAAFAGVFVLQAANAITALLPVALGGALLALPIASLIARNVDLEKGKLSFKKNDVGGALKDLIRTGQKLADTLGKVFKGPFISGLKSATALMKQLVGPMSQAVKAISPGALAMWNGLLASITSFGRAFKPALAGINAGLKQWGIELPKIGAALGQAFSTILKNPALVQRAVQGLSNTLQFLLNVAGHVVTGLTYLAAALGNLWRVANMGENIIGKLLMGLPGLQRLGQAFLPLKQAILAAWDAFKKFATAMSDQEAATRLATLVQKIKAIWGPLKDFLGEVWRMAWNKIKEFWNNNIQPWINNTLIPWLKNKLKEGARWAFNALKDAAKAELKKLPGMAQTELGKLVDKVKQKFDDAKNRAKEKAKALVDGAITKIREIPGKAATAVSTLAGKIGDKFSQAVTRAKEKAKALVDGFITKVKELPGKAATEAGRVKDKIIAKFSNAGSWLKSAGSSIIDGLKSGIESAAGRAADAAASAAKRALSAAKRTLGISSPSKVFAEEVGKPAAQGIGVGLQKQWPVEMKTFARGMPELAMAGAGGATYNQQRQWSPTVHVTVQAGLDPIDAAARRALVRGLTLELEAFKKDYL